MDFKIGLFQSVRDRDAKLLRNRFCNDVHVGIGHPHSSSHIADRGARRKRPEGDDLRNVIFPITATDVGDHLVAPVVAKVHVDIGHADAFGIEESLK